MFYAVGQTHFARFNKAAKHAAKTGGKVTEVYGNYRGFGQGTITRNPDGTVYKAPKEEQKEPVAA